ncbi:Basic membrane protein [Metamycoplasma arthritidis]|uniref:BMP family ABC transporter substrate-binding protein n=1 Tax=Metamycoplasma arthritidis TaxID=2111 RepID=UPI001004E86C|nr:BMP family ABC transporter substrate-binding protein [Metamycoplasma arthritidis]VEU79056.1 Basic membrane protein [Metamycoplasma arthritidis]
MKKLSKLFLAIAGSSTLFTLPLVAAACGQTTHPQRPSEFFADVKKNDTYSLNQDQINNMGKTAVITNGGDINDRSFNQSAWEGVLNFMEQVKAPIQKYDVFKVSDGTFQEAYKRALAQGYKYWVLPGFLNQEQIKKFYTEHKEEMKKKGVRLIAVDFTLEGIADQGMGISINFKIKEGGFMAGYAAGKFLSQYSNAADRTISTFGGGAFPGVTDFNEGFYKGILKWNKEQTDKNKRITSTDGENVHLNSGFEPKDTMTSVINSVLSKNPKMVLPVAGPATNATVQNQSFGNKLIVGVDTDQANTVSKHKDRFFTSILKKIGQSVYDVIASIITGQVQSNLGEFKDGEKSAALEKGVAEGWVGLSKTHLTGEDQAKATEALEAAKKIFDGLDETHKKWLAGGYVKAEDTSETSDIQTRINALSKAINESAQA